MGYIDLTAISSITTDNIKQICNLDIVFVIVQNSALTLPNSSFSFGFDTLAMSWVVYPGLLQWPREV